MVLFEKVIFTAMTIFCLASLSTPAPTPAQVAALPDCEVPVVHQLRLLGELLSRVDKGFMEIHGIYGETPKIEGIVFFEDNEDVEDIVNIIRKKLINFHTCLRALKSLNISQENDFKNEDVEKRNTILDETHSVLHQVTKSFTDNTEDDTPAYCHGLNHTEIDLTWGSKYDKSFFEQLIVFLSRSICQWNNHDDFQAYRNCDVSKNTAINNFEC